jgi:hypothetical protein
VPAAGRGAGDPRSERGVRGDGRPVTRRSGRHTDGLVERRDQALDTGLELLQRAATNAGSDADPDTLCDTLLARLTADQPVADDVALLAVKVSIAMVLSRAAPAHPPLRPLVQRHRSS